MLKLIVHTRIHKLKKEWEELFEQNEHLSAYQTYNTNLIAYNRMFIYGAIEKYRPIFCQILDNDKTVLIAPLCKYVGTRRYCSLGRFNGFQTYDFIYGKDITSTQAATYLCFLVEQLNAEEIKLYNLLEQSRIRNAALSNISICETQNENVNIYFGGDVGFWQSNLSKSTRQNIRTAYNRLKRENMSIRVDVYRGTKINRMLLNDMIDMYCNRHEARYGVRTSRLKRWYLKTLDFSTTCIQKSEDNFYSVCWIGEQPVAFMSGLVDKKGKSVVIPRLSINDNYARFSPGMLLICETINWLSANTAIVNLDLSKGIEKYKLSAGGVIYNTYAMHIRKE